MEKEAGQIELLLDRKVDGLIISSSQQSADQFNHMLGQGSAHVLIYRVFDPMRSASVSVDNIAGVPMAAKHHCGTRSTKPCDIWHQPGAHLFVAAPFERLYGWTDRSRPDARPQ